MIDDRFYSMRGIGKVDSGIPSVMPDDIGSIVSIVVDTPPTKATYYSGDYIDLRGIVILGVYADDSTVDITRWCTVQVREPLALSSTTPVVWFENLSTTFTIQVTGKPVSVPSSAVHIFHFENNGYDALHNLKDSSNNDTYILVPDPTQHWHNGGYIPGCRPRLGLTTIAAKSENGTNAISIQTLAYTISPAATHTDLLKNGKSITIAWWGSENCSFSYGQDKIDSWGHKRYWRCDASATGASMEMSTGDGIFSQRSRRARP